jgi:hypothetical protein
LPQKDSDDIKALTGLNTVEVSLVDAGANRKTYAIEKSQGDTPASASTQTQAETTMDPKISDIVKACIDTPVAGEEALLKGEYSEKAREAVKSAFRTLQAFKKEIPDGLMKALGEACGMKPEPAKEPEAAKKAAPAQAPAATPKMESLPPEVRAELAALWKTQEEAITKANAKLAETEKTLKAEVEGRVKREFVQKARDIGALPGQTYEQVAQSLYDANAVSPELATRLEATFKGAAEAIKAGEAFRMAGSSAQVPGGGAWNKIEAMAAQLVQKSGATPISKAKAVDIVMDQNPDLYKQYLAENKKQSEV